jgi:hypothetical protein
MSTPSLSAITHRSLLSVISSCERLMGVMKNKNAATLDRGIRGFVIRYG